MGSIMEKEVRGAVSREQAAKVDIYALEHGWTKNAYKQVSVYCDTDSVTAIGSVSTGRARLILDIRGDAVKLKVKVGNALNSERREYAITTTKDDVEGLAVLLQLFGVTHGFVRMFDRTDYKTKHGVQLTIKLNCLMGDHFELERNDNEPETVQEFSNIIDTLGLNMWSREELDTAIENDHRSVKSQEIVSIIGTL